MATSIRIFHRVDQLSRFFSAKLATCVRETPDGQFFSIALSGGSTPREVFSYLSSEFGGSVNWQRVQVFWSDERCVDPGSDESNYRMALETLLDPVRIPPANIFRILGEADPVEEADRYGETVREHVTSVEGIPRFDLVLLGLGADGHTASIFPGNLHLFESDNLFEAVEKPSTGQQRITATGRLINHAKTVVFIVTGDTKAEVAARVIERKAGWKALPASRVRPGKGKLLWLLDDKAARKLEMSENPE